MTLLYKKYLAFALFLPFVNTVFSQSGEPPSPTPLPLPYISLQGCDIFAGYSTALQEACKSVQGVYEKSFPAGIIIINHERGADISEAGTSWLILVDGSNGPVLTSEAHPLRLNNQQVLLGGDVSGKKAVLSYSASSPAHLIHAQEVHTVIQGLQLEGINSGLNGALLYINRPKSFVINKSILNTTPVKFTGIDINDDQDEGSNSEPDPAACGNFWASFNNFNLSGSALGIRISCRHGDDFYAYHYSNWFNLSGDSKGIHMIAGRLILSWDTFTQITPASSQNQPPVAVMFKSDSPIEYRPPFNASIIRCATFDGGRYGELIPVSLSDFSGGNRITIAHNVFRNVPVAVRVNNATQTITADSICNIWINNEASDATARCPAVLPNDGFLHFADGVTCGTKPENFVEPDCLKLRRDICEGDESSESTTREPDPVNWPVETMVQYQQGSDKGNDQAKNNKIIAGVAVAGVGITAIGMVTATYLLARRYQKKRAGISEYTAL